MENASRPLPGGPRSSNRPAPGLRRPRAAQRRSDKQYINQSETGLHAIRRAQGRRGNLERRTRQSRGRPARILALAIAVELARRFEPLWRPAQTPGQTCLAIISNRHGGGSAGQASRLSSRTVMGRRRGQAHAAIISNRHGGKQRGASPRGYRLEPPWRPRTAGCRPARLSSSNRHGGAQRGASPRGYHLKPSWRQLAGLACAAIHRRRERVT